VAIFEELCVLADDDDRDIAWVGAVALNNLGDDALIDGDWARAIEFCGRSSEIRRSAGNLWGSALALSNVALAQREAGRLDDAARSLRQALEDSLAVDATMVILACFELGAMLAADRDRPREAATLLGASAQLREELDTDSNDFERDLLQRVERGARALLGVEDFTRAYEDGRSLLLEDATDLVFAQTTDT
jgi:hypothetical protein